MSLVKPGTLRYRSRGLGGVGGLAFSANLKHTLVPVRAVGSATPTFVRATTAYVADWENLLKPVLSGESRFTGARRVSNIVTASEDASGWGLQFSAALVSSIQTAPDGSATAFQFSLPVAGDTGVGSRVLIHTSAVGTGRSANSSVWLKADIAGDIQIQDASSGIYNVTVAVTTSWQRFATGAQAIPVSLIHAVYRPTGSVVTNLYVWHPQREDVTGQFNQNPSEYVSVGVLAAPFHGVGVDGVKYFSTKNGNTVASNVVTEATGAAINPANGASTATTDAGGPFGYLAEGARTNVILQSQTLGTTWTVSNAANMEAVGADIYVAPDGTTTMDRLQPKATTAVHSLDQAFTFTAAVYTTSLYLRYVPATPQRWVALVMNDGTTTWAASFDLLNGLLGATLNATSTITATGTAAVYRVTVTKSAAAAAAAGTVKISLNTTDTATLESSARAGTETLGAWGAQLEAATFASTYVPTTTIAVARNADALAYPLAGNASNTVGTAYVEIVTSSNTPGNCRIVASNTSTGTILVTSGSGQPRFFDGTNFLASGLGNVAVGALAKVASKWSGVSGTVFLGGAAGTPTAFDGDMGMADVEIGGNGADKMFGTIRNVRIYSRALTDAQLVAMTT